LEAQATAIATATAAQAVLELEAHLSSVGFSLVECPNSRVEAAVWTLAVSDT